MGDKAMEEREQEIAVRVPISLARDFGNKKWRSLETIVSEDVPWLLTALATERAQREQAEHALRTIESQQVTLLRDEDVPLYACRDCHAVADRPEDVAHQDWCAVSVARAALNEAAAGEGASDGND